MPKISHTKKPKTEYGKEHLGYRSGQILFSSRLDWETEQGESISYIEFIWRDIERFMSKTLEERLQELIDFLEKQGSKTDKRLAAQLRNMGVKLKKVDVEWEADGVAIDIAESVDWYIEEMLPRYIYSMLHQLMIEGLIASHRSPEQYQEYMRSAAGLENKMSTATEDLITQLHSRLIGVARKDRNQITPGGSASPLKEYEVMLYLHYKRLLPIWRDVKRIFKQHDDKSKHEAIQLKYNNLGVGESWTIKPEYIGLPDELLSQLEKNEEYISSPQYLAYQHAAFLCGFQIGSYSIKQLKRVVSEVKKRIDRYKVKKPI
jgi:hypothetical protein